MKSIFLSLLTIVIFTYKIFAQADCSSAVIICGNTQSFNPSGIGNKLEQLACGNFEHNSVWFAFQAKADGKLNFIIRPFTPAGLPANIDFDWSLFALSGPPGSASCDNKIPISCNFAGTATVLGVLGATGMSTINFASPAFNPSVDVVNGNWYVLMVDQFTNNIPLVFTVQFTGNTESPYLNSSPGIFDNQPDFTFTNTSGCGGTFNFTSTSASSSGIASYNWNFGDGSTSALANPVHTYITSGTYYVILTVTDNNGCKSDIRKTVVYNNTVPTMNTSGIMLTPSCTDVNNGTITVTTTGSSSPGIAGGTVPYTYELVSPSPMIRSSQTSNVFTGLQPGAYVIKATDACGKAVTASVTVAQIATNSTIGISLAFAQASCADSARGTATLFANGTLPSYTFSLIGSSPVQAGPVTALQRDAISANFYATFNDLRPGIYTVEVIDGCGKAARNNFTVPLSGSPTVKAVASASCARGATGTINVIGSQVGYTGNGMPGNFEFALLPPSPITRPYQRASVFENLRPGAYIVAVRDECGSVATSPINVNIATAPTFGTAFTTPSCPDGNTGTIETQIASIGGGSPFMFELIAPSPVVRPLQSGNSFDSLPPGAYVVRLMDVCGAQVTGNVTVPAGTAPTFTTAIGASCSNSSSGTLTITPAASVISPLTFELISPGGAIRPPQVSNIANSTSNIFTGLDQGIYTIRMIDGCGVAVTNTATVTAPTALVFPGATTFSSCASSATGQITITQPATGLGAYKYELISPSPVIMPPQYSRIFNNLPVGNYTMRITDSCGTQVTSSSATINTAAAPSLTVTNTASCATNTGTITCLATVGNQSGGAYQYSLIAPSPVTRPDQISPIFTGLPAGTYTVQITDTCGLTGTVTTTIAAAGSFTPSVAGSVSGCNGNGYYGKMIVSPQNYTTGGPIPPGSGGGPYTYAIYDAANTTVIAGAQASNVFDSINLVSGSSNFTVRVTDVCGNTSTASVTLNPPAALTNAAINATAASCAGSNNGVISVAATPVVSGGLTPYRYSLVNATTMAVIAGPQSSLIFSEVPPNAGGYFVRVTDACGNSSTTTTALSFNGPSTPTATIATTASCTGSSTGRIVATPTTGGLYAGGTFSYSLYDAGNTTLITGPQASPVFDNLAAASYTVRIADRCGTEGNISATVSSSVPALTASGVVSGTCSGGSTGVITASSTGGSLPVTYSLVDQPTSSVIAGPQSNNIFSGLATGTYIVRVTDSCGTIANSSNLALNNLSANPTITTTSALDCGGFAVIAGYGAAGNGGPYTYAFCSGAGCTAFGSYSSTNTLTVTTDGTYRISVRDKCGNSVTSADISVTIPVKAVMTGVAKTNVCGSTTITPSFTGVTNTPSYSIDGSNFSTTLGTIAPGCHAIRVADYNGGSYGCASDPFEFSVFGLPVLSAPALSDVNCNNGIITMNTTGGSDGCSGSGAVRGVKLTACTGCTPRADAIGTIKEGSAVTFNMSGASSASFAPVVLVNSAEICAGTTINLDFVTGYCGRPLPIVIEYFRGFKNGNSHNLAWKVNCINTAGVKMSLERSADSRNFTDIYLISANAARCLQPFEYNDTTPLNGLNYYRIKIVDADGKIAYSDIISLLNKTSGFDIVNIVPSPVPKNGVAIINIASAQKARLHIIISDVGGRKLLSKTGEIIPGSNQIQINLARLAAGSYQVSAFINENFSKTIRFVKE